MIRIKLESERQAKVVVDENGAAFLDIKTPEINIGDNVQTFVESFVDASPRAKAEMHDAVYDVVYQAFAMDWIRSRLQK